MRRGSVSGHVSTAVAIASYRDAGWCSRSILQYLKPFGQTIVLGKVGEARHVGLELQCDRAGRAVPLLADDDLGAAVDLFHLGLPIEIFLAAGARLLVAQVIFLAEHEQHDVGILLDRSRLAQIGELRALVVAVLDLAREL